MISLFDIKRILTPEKSTMPSDDFRIIQSWAEYDLSLIHIQMCIRDRLSTACQRSYKIYTFPFIENYLCEDGKSVVLHNEQTGRVGLSNLRLNRCV